MSYRRDSRFPYRCSRFPCSELSWLREESGFDIQQIEFLKFSTSRILVYIPFVSGLVLGDKNIGMNLEGPFSYSISGLWRIESVNK